MVPQWIIERKRDGQALADDEIRGFIRGFTRGEIPDYQMSALAMAIYFRGMTFEETTCLTDAMLRSGETVDTSSIPIPKVDKHSTGGIGDKVSLVLAPLAACCGVAVPMLAGRGLGITGGTLDKLESIPGYRTDLARDEFVAVLRQCGCSITGQTAELAPADRKLYALRDVTGTVPSIPLIAASIMSKKLAEGADALVLDVKWGKGAFMKTVEEARRLARTMVEIGRRMGKRMTALITDMNQPLGRTAGNVVEVAEAVLALRGQGPADLMAETLELCAHMLLLGGKAASRQEALALLERQIESGRAFEKFKEMARLHGGSDAALDDPSRLPSAAIRDEIPSPGGGYVTEVNAELVGRACLALGAGRTRVEDSVDHAAGITGIVKIGERVANSQPLMTLHANDRRRLGAATKLLHGAVKVADAPPPALPLILDTISDGEPTR